MKSITFATSLIFLIFLNATSQSTGFEWAKGITCTEEFSPSSVKTDSDGNIFVADLTETPPTVEQITNSEQFDTDPKLSPDGKFVAFVRNQNLWIAEPSTKREYALTTDGGSVIKNGMAEFIAQEEMGRDTGFWWSPTSDAIAFLIAKYDSSGIFLWAVRIGGEGYNDGDDEGTSIITDNDGNVLVTGWFQGTVDFNPGAGVHNLSTARVSCFILKLSADGEFIWAEKINSPDGGVEGHTIRTDSKNNVYVSGLFKAATDFNPGEGTSVLEPAEDFAAFLVKLDKNANFRWAIQPGGYAINTNLDKKRPFEIDSEGNIILAFDFRNTVDFNPTEEETLLTSDGNFTDVFIQKLDSLGNLLWVKQIGGPDYEALGGLHLDENNNIYITGYYTGTVDFDPGTSTYELTAGNEWNIGLYIAKYSPEGNLVWAHPVNWLENDGTYSYGYGNDITTDMAGNVISVGKFGGKYNFNPNGIASVLSSADSEYSFSGYVIKLDGITTGMNHFENDISFKYYPNPFTDKITISGKVQFENAELWLRSLSGQTIIHKKNISGNNIELNTGTMPAGIYFLEINQKDAQFVGKVIKQ